MSSNYLDEQNKIEQFNSLVSFERANSFYGS